MLNASPYALRIFSFFKSVRLQTPSSADADLSFLSFHFFVLPKEPEHPHRFEDVVLSLVPSGARANTAPFPPPSLK